MATHLGSPPVSPEPLAAAAAAPRLAGGVPLKLWLGGALLLVAIAYLVLTSLQTSTVYYLTVSELLARGQAAYGQTVRLSGEVVDGSIQRDRQHLRFVLTDGTATIPVTHTGQVPDLFGYRAEGAYQEVVVEGRYTASGVFEARSLIVKHGPTFEAAQ
ncbi:MAG TPA: cytochrome c maturation protein CcmE [Chloroflexota bacterium]|jgi:cytochrome c-type biogenesis protein CcmE|nr:cytochrome c maturation protein CcmE [Chloroflexota bacterium]